MLEKDFCSVLIAHLPIYLFWGLSCKMLYVIYKYNIIKRVLIFTNLTLNLKNIPPKTIHWRPLREVKYPALKVNSITWEIFSQEDIKLKPKEVKQLQLGLGFIMNEGIVLVALANSLKK